MMLFNKKRLIKINDQKVVKGSPWPKVISMLSISALVIYMIYVTQPNFDWELFNKSFKNLFNFKTIDHGFGETTTMMDTFKDSLSMLLDTLAFSFLGTIIGLLIAIPISLASSKNISKNAWIYQPIRAVMSVIRSIPPLVYAAMLFYVFDGPLSATISLSIFVCSITVKWLYEFLDTTSFETYDALISMGLSKPRAVMKAIMPELFKKVISYGLYAFEMVIRFASILGIVGIKTIGYLMSTENKDQDRWGHLTLVLSILVMTIICIELLTIAIKKWFLNPVLRQANLNKDESFELQLVELNKQRSKIYILQRVAIGIFFGLLIFSVTRVNFEIAPDGRFDIFKAGIGNLFRPDWSYITDFGTGVNAIELAIETLLVSILAAMLGAVMGLIFGILGSTNIVGKVWAWPSKIFIIITRSIPTFVYAILFVLSAHENKLWVGVLAMSIRSIGMLGKLTYEKIENTDMGGKQSMDVSGNTVFNSTRIAVISEVLPAIVANALYRIEINFKTATEIGAVGASVFGFQINTYTVPKHYDRLMSYILVVIVFVLLIEQISSLLRKKMMTGYFMSSNGWLHKKIRHKKSWTMLAMSNVLGAMIPKSTVEQEYFYRDSFFKINKNQGLTEKFENTKKSISLDLKNTKEEILGEYNIKLNDLSTKINNEKIEALKEEFKKQHSLFKKQKRNWISKNVWLKLNNKYNV